MREYSFECKFCPATQLTHNPRPPSSWSPAYDGYGWICGHGQCQEDNDTRQRQEQEGIQSDYEAHCEEEAKWDAIEREANGNEKYPWRFDQ